MSLSLRTTTLAFAAAVLSVVLLLPLASAEFPGGGGGSSSSGGGSSGGGTCPAPQVIEDDMEGEACESEEESECAMQEQESNIPDCHQPTLPLVTVDRTFQSNLTDTRRAQLGTNSVTYGRLYRYTYTTTGTTNVIERRHTYLLQSRSPLSFQDQQDMLRAVRHFHNESNPTAPIYNNELYMRNLPQSGEYYYYEAYVRSLP